MTSSFNTSKRRSSAQAVPTKSASKKTRLTIDAEQSSIKSFGDLLDPRKKGKPFQAANTNGVKQLGSALDESRAVVSGGVPDADVDMQDGTSGSDESRSSSEDEDEEEGNHADAESKAPPKAQMTNGVEGHEDPETEEPSFGELLRAHGDEPIDVEALAEHPPTDSRALMPSASDKTLSAPSATSLGTVLTQALRSNDRDLLESCLQVGDLDSIRSTIERLHSSLAASLLQKLAERIYKRPGRAGSLLVWVQWTFVMHGGYLASQPEIVKLVKSLERVIRERANGLQPLLGLKGRLDMIDAQLELRRRLQRRNAMDDDDEDEGVVYVEGQDDADTSEAEMEQDDGGQEEQDTAQLKGKPPPQPGKRKIASAFPNDARSASSEAEEEDMPDVNGDEHNDDDDESSEDASEDLIDDEAEETDDDTGDDIPDDEIDYDDVDEADEQSSNGEEERPEKRSTARRR